MDSSKEANIKELKTLAEKSAKSTKKLFEKLKAKKPRALDEIVHAIHHEVFEETNCLTCANCCKSISPTLYDKDIERLSHQLKMKPSSFIREYINIDKDKYFVFKKTPCPFLQESNYCMVYKNRPKACREYPHTNRKRFYQILNITLNNIYVCPAAYKIIEGLKTRLNNNF